MPTALAVHEVWKRYRVAPNRPLTLREALVRRTRGRHQATRDVWALRGVSFAVEQGRALGIVGHNGAGKSTLLRLLCGVGCPTRGRVARAGPVGGLLELGGGFHPDLTGRENILTAGILNGLSRAEVRRREAGIVAFAELEDAIDLPVRTYSSGMFLRLAFAIAVELEPSILVVDELLAVGDARFQQKCLERIAAYRTAGNTLVVTSHVPEQIRALCDEVVVIEDGQAVAHDAPEAALRCYADLMRARTERRAAGIGIVGPAPAVASTRSGTGEAAVERVELRDDEGRTVGVLGRGRRLVIELEYRIARPVPDLALSVGLYTAGHVKCWEACLPSATAVLGPLGTSGVWRCELPDAPLVGGPYVVNVGLYPPDFAFVYDYHWDMHPLWVEGPAADGVDVTGVLALRPRWARE
jgi:lipopolysaccharide transport system ATP-binding protein